MVLLVLELSDGKRHFGQLFSELRIFQFDLYERVAETGRDLAAFLAEADVGLFVSWCLAHGIIRHTQTGFLLIPR